MSVLRTSILIPTGTALLLAWWFVSGLRAFSLDDAYIHLAYARSLQLGEGLSYNPHDWELGASSPLWSLLLACVPHGWQTVAIIATVCAMMHAATAGLVAFEVQAFAQRNKLIPTWIPTIAGLLIACHPLLLTAVASGMEVNFTALLLCIALCLNLRERFALAALVSGFAVWARPESLVFALGLSGYGWFHASSQRSRKWAVAPLLAAAAAMSAWMAYCYITHGHFFPNTQHVKGHGNILAGLTYLRARVLTEELWLVSLAGPLALAHAWKQNRSELCRLARPAVGLLTVWLLTLCAVAFSRTLRPALLFYMQRYFALVAFLPPLALGFMLLAHPQATRWFALAGMLALLALPNARSLVRAQSEDIYVENVAPALWLRDHVPADAVVLAVDAGANRFFTPRSMRIVDIIGLNNERIAYSADFMCTVLDEAPTHVVLFDEVLRRIGGAFNLRMLHRVQDPEYHQAEPVVQRGLVVAAVEGFSPELIANCAVVQ